MLQLWNWLNGKKTTIGAALLLLSLVVNQVVIGIWHYDTPILENIISTIDWVGGGLAGTGLIHKAIKS